MRVNRPDGLFEPLVKLNQTVVQAIGRLIQ